MSFSLRLITEELDTDLETDRLLGQQRIDDQGFFEDKVK
jgi:amyloid beta (A4) precursor protein-binding family A protein 1 (X11)